MADMKKLTKTQRRQMYRRYFEDGASVTEIAKEFGVCRHTVYSYLSDPELLAEQDARTNRRLILAKSRLASIQPEALDTQIALMRDENYRTTAPYITQNASRDLMDRGGLKLEEERDNSIVFDFANTGIQTGMPEREKEPEDIEEIKRQLAEVKKQNKRLARQVEAEKEKQKKAAEKKAAEKAKKPAAKRAGKPSGKRGVKPKEGAENGDG